MREPPCGYWYSWGLDQSPASLAKDSDFRVKCELTDALGTVVASNVIYVTISGALAKDNALAGPNPGRQHWLDPSVFAFPEAFPNPFNPSTTVPFVVGTRGRARLEVFDLRGHRVAVLFDGPAAPGRTYTARFEGSHLSTGVYYCKLTSSGSARVIRMMLLR